MASFPADRRLYVTTDRDAVVEEDDPRAGFLLVAEGNPVPAQAVEDYGLTHDGERVVIPEAKMRPPAENKMAAPAPTKAVNTSGPMGEVDEDQEEEGPEWTLDMDPATYLERYPNGPNAELARQVLEE